jgi:hypothetical protein
MRALILAALVAAAPAMAVPVARIGGDVVRLTDAPCSGPVLAMIQPGPDHFWLLAHATVDGKPWTPCWRMLGNSVHLLYEDADQGVIPLTEFKDEQGI